MGNINTGELIEISEGFKDFLSKLKPYDPGDWMEFQVEELTEEEIKSKQVDLESDTIAAQKMRLERELKAMKEK